MKKIATLFVSFALVASAVPALAETASSTTDTVQSLLTQIQQLQQQIIQLRQQLNQVQQQEQQIVATLVSNIQQGSSGDQVKILQALLAADPGIYPEGLITGFFGRLTANAVKRYQKKHGLPQVGIVGPKTLEKLNEYLRDNPIALESTSSTQTTSTTRHLCAIVPPGHLIAPGWIRKNDGERPIVPNCQTLPPGIWNKLYGTSSSTTTSTVDVTPPVISGVIVSASTSSVTVGWVTNELATSQVLYGTTTALGLSTGFDSTLIANHSQSISGLTPNTAYYYAVQSKDASGNLASSVQQSFTTASLDVTPPVISGVTSAAASTTATISWTTNELATSQVSYGTSTTLGLNTVLDSNLVTSHLQTLSGIATGTTYYYSVKSQDGSGNMATSTQQSFMAASQ